MDNFILDPHVGDLRTDSDLKNVYCPHSQDKAFQSVSFTSHECVYMCLCVLSTFFTCFKRHFVAFCGYLKRGSRSEVFGLIGRKRTSNKSFPKNGTIVRGLSALFSSAKPTWRTFRVNKIWPIFMSEATYRAVLYEAKFLVLCIVPEDFRMALRKKWFSPWAIATVLRGRLTLFNFS